MMWKHVAMFFLIFCFCFFATHQLIGKSQSILVIPSIRNIGTLLFVTGVWTLVRWSEPKRLQVGTASRLSVVSRYPGT